MEINESSDLVSVKLRIESFSEKETCFIEFVCLQENVITNNILRTVTNDFIYSDL